MLSEDVDGIFRALSDQRRRIVCRQVSDVRRSGVELCELAERVQRKQNSKTERTASADEVLLELQHVHLPLLDDAGVVSYDVEDGRVQPGPWLSLARSLLRAAEQLMA